MLRLTCLGRVNMLMMLWIIETNLFLGDAGRCLRKGVWSTFLDAPSAGYAIPETMPAVRGAAAGRASRDFTAYSPFTVTI